MLQCNWDTGVGGNNHYAPTASPARREVPTGFFMAVRVVPAGLLGAVGPPPAAQAN
jgi:hypothetical protein